MENFSIVADNSVADDILDSMIPRVFKNKYTNNRERSPQLSINIPIYNIAPYIDRCIESILPGIEMVKEIILVDDGSTDDSAQICDGWVEKMIRFNVFIK